MEAHFNKDEFMKFISYKGCCVPEDYLLIKDDIENHEVRDDDIWVCSFPKCGTTWVQEMAWCIANNLDYEKASSYIHERYFSFEMAGTAKVNCMLRRISCPELDSKTPKAAEKLPSPRFMKSHLPFHLLPEKLRTGKRKPKIIYVIRNPKDACISYYHYRLMFNYVHTFDEYCNDLLEQKVNYSPIFEHMEGFWEKKDSHDILILSYENMKLDLPSVIRKTADYLGKSLSEEHIEKLAEHLSFQNMKSNPAVNWTKNREELIDKSGVGSLFKKCDFFRKGEANQWKTDMSAEFIEKFDSLIESKLGKYPDLIAQFD